VQTRFIYERLKSALSELGSSITDVVQIEQFLAGKQYADGYIEASRGQNSGVFERDRPASALVWTGAFEPEDCLVLPTLTAARPEHGAVKEIALRAPGIQNITAMPGLGGAYATEPIYNELVTAGDYAFPVGLVASDWETGVHPNVRIPDWVTHGDAARNETAYNLRILERTLQTIGGKLANTVHCTIYLVDLGDLYELDRVWEEWFPEPDRRPSRTIVPVPSLLLPRDEKAKTHSEGAVRMEWLAQAVRPGSSEPQPAAKAWGQLHARGTAAGKSSLKERCAHSDREAVSKHGAVAVRPRCGFLA
jgi:enamine deaminase RidA (YjgF/YER057c/UK114 family)